MSSATNKKVVKHLRKGVSIYKTDRSPFWFARIWNPKSKKYLVRSTKEEARLLASEVTLELADSLSASKFTNVKSKRPADFQTFAERFLEEVRQRTKGKTGSYVYGDTYAILYRARDGLIPYFGSMSVLDISAGTIRQYLTDLDSNRKMPLATSTKSKQLMVLKQVLELAVDDDVLAKVPRFPKLGVKDTARPTFTVKQYLHFMRVARRCVGEGVKVRFHKMTHEDVHVMQFIVHSYLRPTTTELFALRRRDVSFEEEPSRMEARVMGKTGYRRVVLNPSAIHYWRQLLWGRGGQQPHYPDDAFLYLPDYPNRRTAAQIAGLVFKYIVREAGLEFDEAGQARTLYSLRHFAIQERLRSSKGQVNLYWLAQNAGTSVDQLERFYLRYMEFTAEQIENLHSGLFLENQ